MSALPALAVRREQIPLFPRQRRFVRSKAHYPAYIGGIGSGKTFAGACKVIARLPRKQFGLVAAPTYDMLRLATQRTLFTLMDDLGIVYDYNKSEKWLVVPSSGHEIAFRSLEDADKTRGPNVNWLWVDEGSLIPGEAWRIMKGRARIDDLNAENPDLNFPFQAWLTGTPKGRNWVWEEWERDATGTEFDPLHPLFRVRSDENPELPEGFVESLGYTGVFADQEIGGEFVAHEGLVYPAFVRTTHVAVVDTDGWRRVLGVDIGTRNPTAILDARVAGDGRFHIAAEVYRRNMSSSDILAAIAAVANQGDDVEAVYIDPSAAGYRMDLDREGLPMVKANNAVMEGIGRVTTALAEGLTVDPSCVNLIAEFESYAYPEGGRVDKDAPVKQNDHALDSLRYIVAGEASPPSEVFVL